VKTPDGKEYKVQKTSQVTLLIEDLVLGDGSEAKASSTITLNYHGTLAKNGEKFDGNWGEEPITFPLQNLIDGWKVGIPGMKVGGLRKLTIPWQLAYGERGSGPIPAKADLVFLIELKGVK
jgi:peptidylprolyl isomerase